ncbi:DUF4135 domain-containing protein [Azospirillum sp. B510]|uniref:DUF4135 domain-containing protein n=1 Tax=Azospirillum sp. (strain B510) TaxID=137722 RepID=UPI0003196F4A|nr:DUF4135 domain-containing protein [Azospirillum sp. B510]
MAARASRPDERGDPCWRAEDVVGAPDRLALWRDAVAKGNEGVFRTVTGWRGIDVEIQAARLAPVRLVEGAPLPDWVHRFLALLDDSGVLAAETPSEIVERLAAHACRRIEAQSAVAGLAADAVACLRRQAAAGIDSLLRPSAQSVQPPPGPDGFGVLFRRCPVLARLLVEFLERWTTATAETLDRLAADRPSIVATLFEGRDPGPVTAVSDDNADPHDGCRRVLAITFADGRRLVYKPRSLAVDVAVAALVEWLAARDRGFDLRVPRALNRGTHGWCAFIAHRPAADSEEEGAFYRRCGRLLALCYAIDINDLHYENIIAQGGWPVPIDLETALTPLLGGPDALAAEEKINEALGALAFGVLRTGLLPSWMTAGRMPIDMGGISDPRDPAAARLHRPTAGRIEPILARHARAIADGFLAGCRTMLDRRAELLAPDGPLAALSDAPLRFLFRNTQLYAQLLRRSLMVDATGDAADRDIVLEKVARALCLSVERPAHAGLVDAEKRALEALDVPRFQILADGRTLFDHTGPLGEVPVAATALERARTRLQRMTESAVARQERILVLALQARVAATADALPPLPVPQTDEAQADQAPADARVAAAVMLARRTEADVFFKSDDGMVWTSLFHWAEHDLFLPRGHDSSLGYGGMGTALLFAALHPLDAGHPWADRCRAALRPIIAGLDLPAAAERYRKVRHDPGLISGVAGIAGGLARAGALIAWPEATDAAERLARRLLGDRALADYDALAARDGLAGAVLGLSMLEDALPGRGWLEAAIGAGQVLDARATPVGLAALATARGRASAGVPDGPAGVALAALALLKRTGEAVWGDLAIRALKAAPAADVLARWDRGGGALAVRAMAVDAGLPVSPPEEAALAGLVAVDTLADPVLHGRAGAAAILEIVGASMARPDLSARAAAIDADLAARAMADGLRLFRHDIQGGAPAGLCHGRAGIALRLLRHVPGGMPDPLFGSAFAFAPANPRDHR